MEILTGGICGETMDTAVLLHRTVRRKGNIPIAFLCVLQGAEDLGERALLEEWFRGCVLPLCERGGPERAADAVGNSFVAHFGCGSRNMAALFCMGAECFYAWQGSAQLRMINVRFGRAHMTSPTFLSEGLHCERAVLEPGVGLVLGNRQFFDHLSESQLKECLKAGEMERQEQVQRHLAEAVAEAERRGAGGAAAAFLTVREGHSAEFEILLRQNGYVGAVPVGRGAFGSVYRVKRDGRLYACKLAEGVEAGRLLRREASLQRSLAHPLFAHFEDLLEGQACTLLIMEYVRGRDLSSILESHQPAGRRLSERQALRIAIQLAEGLQYLHTLPNPVLYRDLKPENVRITSAGRVKLLDLGCACELSEAQLSRAGTEGYAPPEQMKGGQPGFYSDVYALGKLLHYMLTGDNPCAPPRKGDSRPNCRKPGPDVERLIGRCVEENPRDRMQDMCCVLSALRRC